MPSSTLTFLKRFWNEHPALLYGLSILLGCAWATSDYKSLALPILFLWIPLFICNDACLKIKLILAFCVFLLSVLYCSAYYRFPNLPEEGAAGRGILDISSISSSKTHFGSYWIYKGALREFIPRDGPAAAEARHLPIQVTLIDNEELLRPKADRAYRIQGRLREDPQGYFQFIPDKASPWFPIKGSWSFAEMRYRAKSAVFNYINAQMAHKRSGTFLAGIATGDFDDALMAHELGRFGLQHIMAISGFHFAIIASILGFGLRLLLTKKIASGLLIFLLSAYFVFLGCGPSILRAWITITITLIGFLCARRAMGLNSLGVALILVLIADPLMWRSIGFQFSFAATAAILLLYSSCDHGMQRLFAKRSLSHTIRMDLFNQHGYCLLAAIRQALALLVAVNLIALPMTLYYFHKFPWMSLIYNLFFPFLVSISMLLLILGTLFHLLLPPLGAAIHAFNDRFTYYMLNYTYQMPVAMDFMWRVESFSAVILILYLCVAFTGAIWLREHISKERA